MKDVYGTFVKKTDQEYKINWEKLPQKSQEYLIQRGLDHCQDVHAGIHGKVMDAKTGDLKYPETTDVHDAVHNAMTTKIKALNDGVISIRSGGLTPTSPIEKIAYGLAKKDILAELLNNKIDVKTVDKMLLHQKIMDTIESLNTNYITRAKTIFDAKETGTKTAIDISELLKPKE